MFFIVSYYTFKLNQDTQETMLGKRAKLTKPFRKWVLKTNISPKLIRKALYSVLIK